MADRIPLGDNSVHIGSSDFVANGGAVERGPSDLSPGQLSMGAGSFGTTGGVTPGSPSVGSLQVDPIDYEPNFSAAYSIERGEGEAAWKGVQPSRPYTVTGFDPKE